MTNGARADLIEWWETFPRKGWQEFAACRDMPIETFFGHETRTAKRICLGCDVIEDCLAYALKNEQRTHGKRAGMYGGMLPSERTRFAKELAEHRIDCLKPGNGNLERWQ